MAAPRRATGGGTASPSRPRRRGEQRQRILDAAEALLREGGAEGLSMRHLAGRADVGHVTPYQQLGSKAGVLRAVLERWFAPHVGSLLVEPGGDDPLGGVFARQSRLVDLLAGDEAFLRSALVALDASVGPAERFVWLDLVTGRYRNDLRLLVGAGLVRADAPLELTTRHLLVAHDGAVRRWFRGLSDLDQLRADLRSATCHALLAIATPSGHDRLWPELVRLTSGGVGTAAGA